MYNADFSVALIPCQFLTHDMLAQRHSYCFHCYVLCEWSSGYDVF
uniref:Uncharacterized protein n=1 Tax=Arundo donax TaxID=35708 RepID=A0A0A9EZZ2_ARUDO